MFTFNSVGYNTTQFNSARFISLVLTTIPVAIGVPLLINELSAGILYAADKDSILR